MPTARSTTSARFCPAARLANSGLFSKAARFRTSGLFSKAASLRQTGRWCFFGTLHDLGSLYVMRHAVGVRFTCQLTARSRTSGRFYPTARFGSAVHYSITARSLAELSTLLVCSDRFSPAARFNGVQSRHAHHVSGHYQLSARSCQTGRLLLTARFWISDRYRRVGTLPLLGARFITLGTLLSGGAVRRSRHAFLLAGH